MTLQLRKRGLEPEKESGTLLLWIAAEDMMGASTEGAHAE
jgi:hypothetical protein